MENNHKKEPKRKGHKTSAKGDDFISVALVDDNQTDLEIYSRYLQKNPRFHIESWTYSSATDFFKERHNMEFFDCIVTDYRMNDIDGIKFINMLKLDDFHSAPVVIMMSSVAKEEEIAESLKAGASDFIQKDKITSEGLVRAVVSAWQKRRLLRELDSLKAKLIRSNNLAALGEVAGGIAHEINNPLAILSGQLELMALTDDPHKIKKLLNKADCQIHRIKKIIDGVLKFSRKSGSIRPTTIDLNRIINNDVMPLCEDKMQRSGVKFSYSIPEDLSPFEFDDVHIGQILVNLINNGVDAISSLPEKWIEINARNCANGVEIDIVDSGSGIPEQTAASIMNAFFTTKDVGKGTGLGLSISKNLAETHGATLEYCAECKNTLFRLQIPTKQVLHKDFKIVVADDEESIRLVLAEELQSFTCFFAKDGVEALQLVAKENPNLLLADLTMPNMDGFELIGRVKKTRPELSIIIMTAYLEESLDNRLEGIRVIDKPFSVDQLLSLIASEIDQVDKK